MSRIPVEGDDRRVLVTARVSPRTMRFIKTIRAKNVGRALDNLVAAHTAFLRAMRNRAQVSEKRMIQRQPETLNLPERK
jgi:hypothetical protein